MTSRFISGNKGFPTKRVPAKKLARLVRRPFLFVQALFSLDMFHNLQNTHQTRWFFPFLAKNREVFSGYRGRFGVMEQVYSSTARGAKMVQRTQRIYFLEVPNTIFRHSGKSRNPEKQAASRSSRSGLRRNDGLLLSGGRSQCSWRTFPSLSHKFSYTGVPRRRALDI